MEIRRRHKEMKSLRNTGSPPPSTSDRELKDKRLPAKKEEKCGWYNGFYHPDNVTKFSGFFSTSNRCDLFRIQICLDGPSVALFAIALATRLFRIEYPRSVVFDELHFVKYASLYASNTFFFDTQPPLGKQIISIVAYFCGYRGLHQGFERIGGEYPPEVPVFALRLVPALFGSLIPPLCYRLCLVLGLSQPTAALAGVLLLCDTALLTQSRFVLMESLLIFFSMFGLYCVLRYRAFTDFSYASCSMFNHGSAVNCQTAAAGPLGTLQVNLENSTVFESRSNCYDNINHNTHGASSDTDSNNEFSVGSSVTTKLRTRENIVLASVQAQAAPGSVFGQRSAARWGWLIAGALSLGCAASVKNAGAFVLLLAAYLLTRQLWIMLADNRLSDLELILHTVARASACTLLPAFVYVLVFYVHLGVLTRAGPHDTVMTSAFQASLEGGLASITRGQPSFVAHGSQITLRHSLGRTCWLHSHKEVYPLRYPDGRGSSHQQQVTCYSYKDVNNWWIIKRVDAADLVVSEPVDRIRHGDIIQLVHGITMRLLNSHDVASPLSPALQEVSCFIDYNITRFPPHTEWRVEILNRDTVGDYWATIHSQVRLIHVDSGQALRYSGKQLPEWGFNQHEVVTDRAVEHHDAIWNVEEHRYTKKKDEREREMDLVSAEFVPLEPTRLSFWQKFVELQYKMFIADNENIEDHMFASTPIEWPFLLRGIAYWINPQSNAQIFLLGNPILWWTGTLSVLVYSVMLGAFLLRRRRGCYDIPEDMFAAMVFCGEVLLGGYFVHLLPYFFCDRSLFLHHYLPAATFKPLITAALVQFIDQLISLSLTRMAKLFWLRRAFYVSVATWLALVVWACSQFAAFSYGIQEFSATDIDRLRWLDSWQFIVHRQ